MQQRQQAASLGDDTVVCDMDGWHQRACHAHRKFLSSIAEADRRELWRDEGAHDMAHWLWMRYGISDWKARRWIAAAHALTRVPRIATALDSGELGIDKVVELTRFASPEIEAGLIRWATEVSCGAIRRKGDLAARTDAREVVEADRDRTLSWWFFDEDRRFGLQAELPAAQGSIIAGALERLAETIPAMPAEEHAAFADA